MKTTFPVIRYLLLAWLIVNIVGIMAVPFASRETLSGIVEAFRSVQKFFFLGFLLALAVYSLWGANRTSEKRRSREECRRAYEALYYYFSEHPLEGAGTEQCKQLQEILEAELSRHYWFFGEFAHEDLRRYRYYLREVRQTTAVY